jgi:hypothetical protein
MTNLCSVHTSLPFVTRQTRVHSNLVRQLRLLLNKRLQTWTITITNEASASSLAAAFTSEFLADIAGFGHIRVRA